MNTINLTPPSNLIAFQKKLKANCAVVKGDKPVKCKIYQLEKDKDEDYFSKIKYSPNWVNSCFADIYDDFINRNVIDTEEIHVIEDDNENCIGFCEITENDKTNQTEFNFIESISKKNPGSGYGFVGETLIAYMAKKGLLEQKDALKASSVMRSAEKFYKRNNFDLKVDPQTNVTDGYLSSEDFAKIILKNNEHTKSAIELIG